MGLPFYVVIFAGQRKYVLSSFLSYFKTLSIGPAPEIEPMTSQSAVKRSNNWTTPVVVRSEEKQNVTNKNLLIHHFHIAYNTLTLFNPQNFAKGKPVLGNSGLLRISGQTWKFLTEEFSQWEWLWVMQAT